MMIWSLFVFTLAGYVKCQNCSVLADPRVFDPLFYLNSNPDLMDAGYRTASEAVEHWCSLGIDEGRQGVSMFHAVQYINRYDDLKESMDGNWRMGTEHYVLNGYDEGRIGYTEGGSNGRWTVRSNNPFTGQNYVHLSTSERSGGAIDSLNWANKEFINNYDHGRQFQLAVTVPPYGECFNPTEAGGAADGTGTDTRSIIQSMSASGNALQTVNHPAYWLLPGATAPQYSGEKCQVGYPAVNESPTHPFDMSKNVTIGCFGMDNCIQFNMDAHLGTGNGIPTDYGTAQLEAPTAYLMADFTEAKRWNYDTGELTEAEGGEMPWPVIIHTADEAYALGSYASPSNEPLDGYAYYDFGINGYVDGTFKWSIVWRDNTKLPGDHLVVTSWSCVGDLNSVVTCLTNVRNSVLMEEKNM